MLLAADDAGRWISAARAVADAGLLAVVSLDMALLDAAGAAVAGEEARLLVVRASAGAGPGNPAASTLELEPVSVEDNATAVVKALRSRGWVV